MRASPCLGRVQKTLVQQANPGLEVGQGTGIFDHFGGPLQAVLAAGLGGHDAAHLVRGEAAAFLGLSS